MVQNRLNARRGQIVRLTADFKRNGTPTDPYAIRKVDIYRSSVNQANLVVSYVLDSPCADPTTYPAPVVQATETIPAGQCGTAEQPGAIVNGGYYLDWLVPNDAEVPCIYHDVWTYLPVNPCTLPGAPDAPDCVDGCPDLSGSAFDSHLLSCCHRFWVYPDGWNCSDDLQTVRFGFEPLDQRFNKPEVRPLEIAIQPLPLYDYNYNLVMPMIPLLRATITITTQHCETLVQDAPMELGLRQGSYRTSPYVMKYVVDSSNFMIGTYQYRITLHLPDGSTRTSRDFIMTIG